MLLSRGSDDQPSRPKRLLPHTSATPQHLAELSGVSIVITKQDRRASKVRKLVTLEEVNERTPGLPIRAFASLGGLAPQVGGSPAIVGPYDKIDQGQIPAIRTLGFRKRDDLPPIMHAKLALLGHLWWHDEGPRGHPDDVLGFSATRLWVSSANFTQASRRSLEFGYWTEEPALVQGAERFLLKAIRSSEGLDPESDSLDPELAPVDFDDAAFAEVMAEFRWDDDGNLDES
jgi:hypothetical protein